MERTAEGFRGESAWASGERAVREAEERGRVVADERKKRREVVGEGAVKEGVGKEGGKWMPLLKGKK